MRIALSVPPVVLLITVFDLKKWVTTCGFTLYGIGEWIFDKTECSGRSYA